MREFIINQNDADQRLDKFLSKAVKLLPKNLLYKYIRLKRIKVNGRRTEISYRLMVGDKVSLYINDEFFESEKPVFLYAKPQIDIVYEDDNIMLVDKKEGLIVHEDEGEDVDTLINRVKHYLYLKGEYDPEKESSFAPALCNRIDRNTGGIVIVAKTAEALRILNEKIKMRELHKFYLCLVKGTPPKKEDTLTAYHRKNEKENIAEVFNAPKKDTKTMITKYKVLESNKKYSLLEVEIKTGRFHQIRAHMAHIGCPLVGDGKYSENLKERKLGFKYQALYSYKLIFDFKDECALSYLNGKIFKVEKVPFAENGIPDVLCE